MNVFRSLQVITVSVFAAALMGCAGAKIKAERTPLQPGALSKADILLVKPISADKAIFTGDKADDNVRIAEEKSLLKALLADEIIAELKKKGFNAKRYAAGEKGAVLDGVITLFEHGSGAARAWVGMGAGSSNLHMNVKIKKSGTNIADFDVIATSGGRGGLFAMSSFIHAHITDASEKTVDYIAKKSR